jgi:hypothetical protein
MSTISLFQPNFEIKIELQKKSHLYLSIQKDIVIDWHATHKPNHWPHRVEILTVHSYNDLDNRLGRIFFFFNSTHKGVRWGKRVLHIHLHISKENTDIDTVLELKCNKHKSLNIRFGNFRYLSYIFWGENENPTFKVQIIILHFHFHCWVVGDCLSTLAKMASVLSGSRSNSSIIVNA